MTLIEAYLTFLSDNAKDNKTIRSYRQSVYDYQNWIGSDDAVLTARPLDIKKYLTYLRHDRRMAPSTVNKYAASLKSLYKFLQETQKISINPMEHIKRVSVADSSQGRPKWLSPIEQDRFLDYASLEKNEWLRTRNLAIIDIMLFAGLRVQEVADLQIEDISRQGKDLKIIIRDGKKGKYGEVMIIAKYALNLKKWLQLRKTCDKNEHINSFNLFVSERTGQITTRNIQKFVSNYSELADIQKITPHRLRHTFCKNLARKGTPIEVIRRLARHENIATTAIYIDPGAEELVEALRKM